MEPIKNIVAVLFILSISEAGSFAGDIVTTPIKQFGYGNLTSTAISPDGKTILTGSSVSFLLI